MTADKHEQLWKVYEATFNLFATDVPELAQATELSESQVRSSLKTLAAENLVDAYDVNEEAQGGSRRGQYKHLTWQANETYDSTNIEGARATFLAAIPAPHNATGQGGTTAAQPQEVAKVATTQTKDKATRERAPEQKKVVKQILKLREEGHGYPGIAKILNDKGVATFGKGAQWYGPVVRYIIIGEVGSADKSLKLAGTKRPERKSRAQAQDTPTEDAPEQNAPKATAPVKSEAKPDPKSKSSSSKKGGSAK